MKFLKRLYKKRVLRLTILASAIWLILQVIFLPSGSEYSREAPRKSAMMKLYEQHHPDSKVRYSYQPLNRISRNLRLAVLVAEDMDFPSHYGFAFSEMYNSIADSIRNFRIPRGASTITQQLAKNLYLSPSRNPLRKIKEAIITVKLEQSLSKTRIFELYLNIVELGPGVFGAESAARYWFSKSAADLNVAEAAKLAAMLPGPNSAFDPLKHPSRVSKRQQLLIRRISKANLPAGL